MDEKTGLYGGGDGAVAVGLRDGVSTALRYHNGPRMRRWIRTAFGYLLLVTPMVGTLAFRWLCFQMPWWIASVFGPPSGTRAHFEFLWAWRSRFFDAYFDGLKYTAAGVLLFAVILIVPSARRVMRGYSRLMPWFLIVNFVVVVIQLINPIFFD